MNASPTNLTCPHCESSCHVPELPTSDLQGARTWSDGRIVGPLSIDDALTLRCPACGHHSWLSDWGASWEETLRAGPVCDEVLILIADTTTYRCALDTGVASTPEQERLLRLLAWQLGNDPYRRVGAPPRATKTRWRRSVQQDHGHLPVGSWERMNVERLVELLDRNQPVDSVYAAEAFRQLGRHEDALALLDADFGPALEEAAAAIRDAASAGVTNPVLLPDDDGGLLSGRGDIDAHGGVPVDGRPQAVPAARSTPVTPRPGSAAPSSTSQPATNQPATRQSRVLADATRSEMTTATAITTSAGDAPRAAAPTAPNSASSEDDLCSGDVRTAEATEAVRPTEPTPTFDLPYSPNITAEALDQPGTPGITPPHPTAPNGDTGNNDTVKEVFGGLDGDSVDPDHLVAGQPFAAFEVTSPQADSDIDRVDGADSDLGPFDHEGTTTDQSSDQEPPVNETTSEVHLGDGDNDEAQEVETTGSSGDDRHETTQTAPLAVTTPKGDTPVETLRDRIPRVPELAAPETLLPVAVDPVAIDDTCDALDAAVGDLMAVCERVEAALRGAHEQWDDRVFVDVVNRCRGAIATVTGASADLDDLRGHLEPIAGALAQLLSPKL